MERVLKGIPVYWVCAVLGGLIQVVAIGLVRAKGQPFLRVLPLVIAHQFLFMTGYAKAPNFVLQWFTTSALTGIASLCAGIWLFGDRVSLAAMGGVVLVFGGLGLMRL